MTYSVELVEPSDTWPSGTRVEASCGAFLHFDRMSVQPGKLTRDSGGSEGCECIPRDADFMLDGITELEPGRKPFSDIQLVYSARIGLDGGCEGTLDLDLNQDFATGEAGMPRGFVFTRTFQADGQTADECEAAGMPSATSYCGDSWSANVYDADGFALE